MKRATIMRLCTLLVFIVAISLLHYLTPLQLPHFHAIFQRLYYLPIILAALWFGLRGGLACAVVVSIAYAPHILFQWGGPVTMGLEKYLEILLYNMVGGMTGLLSQRERERAVELEKTARGLEESYQKLQAQSERIITIEEQLRQSEKLSALGEMAAMLAHEIRNPLGSIRGTAEILCDGFVSGDPKHEFADILIKETERLNNVVEDYLRIARQKPATLRNCSIKEELETIVTLVSKDAKNRGISLHFEPYIDDAVVKGDGEKLRQAFLNLVMNALQATPVNGKVEVTIHQEASGYEIDISDSGIGIDADTLTKIFNPFFTTRPDGTGLGLAITKKVIEELGGAIKVKSEVGCGTTSTVWLPFPEGELQ